MDLWEWAAAHQDETLAGASSAGPVRPPCTVSAASMPADIRSIAAVLASRMGPAAAITASDLADAAGLFQDSSRAARGTRLRHLLTLHLDDLPFPVAATADGFFRVDSIESARAYNANLIARALGDLARLQAFSRALARSHFRDAAIRPSAIERLVRHAGALSDAHSA